VRIEFHGLPDTLFLLNKLPTDIKVTLRGKGKHLLLLALQKLRVELDLSRLRPGKRSIRISKESIPLGIEGVEIVKIAPKELELIVDRLASRRVKVVVNTKKDLSNQYAVRKSVVKERVRLLGPSTLIRDYKWVSTEPISLSGKDSTFSTKAKVVPPLEEMRVRPESVTVTIFIEKRIKREFPSVRLRIVGISRDRVKLSPDTIKVVLSGPRSLVEKLREKDVRAILDLKNYEPGEYKIVPSFRIPTGAEVESYSPTKVSVKIAPSPSS